MAIVVLFLVATSGEIVTSRIILSLVNSGCGAIYIVNFSSTHDYSLADRFASSVELESFLNLLNYSVCLLAICSTSVLTGSPLVASPGL